MCLLQIPLPESQTHLQAIDSGQLDAIAVWFDLHLDKETSFSTALSWDISWEQAVFPVMEDLHIERGDIVHLHASCSDTLLSMTVENVERLESEMCIDKSVCTEETSTPGMEYEATPPNSVSIHTHDEMNSKKHCETASNRTLFYVERSELLRLNDAGCMESYRRALSEAIKAAKSLDSEEEDDDGLSEEESSSSESEGDCLVLDMTKGLSVFGLVAAKEGQ